MRLFTFLAIFCCSFIALADQNSVGTNEVWIDVRTWAEYQIDHIDGDPRIHYTDIVEQVSEHVANKDTPIRLYCRSGGRSGKATEALMQAGYTNVENAGGIDDARRHRRLTQD